MRVPTPGGYRPHRARPSGERSVTTAVMVAACSNLERSANSDRPSVRLLYQTRTVVSCAHAARVVSEIPPAGTSVPAASTITLTVAPEPQPTLTATGTQTTAGTEATPET
jgi:beta-lactam-binding protein with PASTA domain